MDIYAGIINLENKRTLIDDGRPGVFLKTVLESYGWKVVAESLVPDDKFYIQKAIHEHIITGCNLIFIAGGIGISDSEVAPDALLEIADREVPGIGELIRHEYIKKNKKAILWRPTAAVVKKSLVICIPGKPLCAIEAISFIADTLPDAIQSIQEFDTDIE